MYFCNPKTEKEYYNLKTQNKMKKVMLLMAVAGMFAFAACNNTKPAEQPEEEMTTTSIESLIDEATENLNNALDTATLEVEAVAEEEAAQ